ncbi:MAG TPA: glycosyltransferase family 39 protein [Nanoarchaeota archaeon]|nr:glycosyltransferase family 39 protein [Nanoarchaeota archaeon]HIH34048.1 glycosyltransferase family 39 protein [Nanoarchaeota archaeon]HIH51831.1 glycosyltransferase family 39 protein [Nanoarchaeota archaeon]HIH66255.1 glycosyltransferase family 39 protein [Nanoarchaeota archaeon]
MYWPITLLLGLIIIFVIGYLLFLKFRLKSDAFLFSVGLGTMFIVFLLFSINQYFRLPISPTNTWIAIISSLLFLLLVNYNLLIREVPRIKFKFKPKFSAFSILILAVFIIAFYKSVFFPITADDAVLMYAFISERSWDDGFPPSATSSYMEISYAYPNTNFVLFFYNYFFGLNFGFDDIFIRVLIPLFSLLNLLLFYRLSFALFKNKEIAQLTAVIFASSTIFASGIIQEYTTMYEVFFSFMAVYAFVLYNEDKDYRYLVLTGVFLASILMIKYTLIPFVLFFLVSMLVFNRSIKTIVKLAIVIIPVSLVFYLRNIISYKNPVYPFFFGGENFNAKLFEIQNTFANVPSYTVEQLFVALIPISLFIFIFFICFLLDYIKSEKKNSTYNILILTAVLYLLFWSWTSAFIKETQGMRHLIESFGIISLFSAAFLYKKIHDRSKIILYSLIPAISAFSIYWLYFVFVPDPYFEYSKNLLTLMFLQPVLLTCSLLLLRSKINSKKILALVIISLMIVPIGFAAFAKRTALWEYPSDEEVIERYYPDHFEVFQYINKNLPADAKILSLYNQRYYIKREILPADSPRVSFLYENTSIDSAINKLESMGVNYILVSEMEKNLPFWQISVVHRAHEERNLKLTVLYKNEEVTLYEIS